jgi:hypothetical protein
MASQNCIRALEIIKEALYRCEEEDISHDDIGAALLSEAVANTVKADGCCKAAEKLSGISRIVLNWAKKEQR